MKRPTGFTLVELVVTITITAILLSIAIPNFSEWIRQNRLTATINNFVAVNSLTRSEAVARGKAVSICNSDDATTSTPSCGIATNWEDGWIVFVNEDDDSPAALDAGETVLRVSSALTSTYSLRGSAGAAAFVTYRPTGDIDISGTFVLCKDNDLSYARAVFISANGRILNAERNSSGVPLDESGTALTTCTP